MNKLEQWWLLFWRNGTLSISSDHFLAMFPASILVPVLINHHFGETVIDISLVLIANAIGTVLFLIITKRKLPVYLGSSFAFIGLSMHLATDYLDQGFDASLAYSYILWAYILAAAIMLVLSFIYKYKTSKKIMSFLFPSAIMGSVVSLIGLELASVGASDAGFNDASGIVDLKVSAIALLTLLIILLASVIRRNLFKNSSIIIGVGIGYLLSAYFLNIDFSPIKTVADFKIPDINIPFLHIPPNLLSLFVSVLPATIVIFMENISRITVVNRLKSNAETDNQPEELFSYENNKEFFTSLRGHAVSIFLSGCVGSVPTTIYAENIAVMSINNNDANMKHESFNPFSCVPYIGAAVISVVVAILGKLQYLLMNIPKPVIGGVELFLFGIITAPGIQMLVEQRVNYKKISNQILTAGVLVAGVGGFSVNFGTIELKGMSLGLVIGVLLNILFKTLGFFGILNEHLSFDETVKLCKDNCTPDIYISESKDAVELLKQDRTAVVIIEKGKTNTYLKLKMPQDEINKWCGIYDDVMDSELNKYDNTNWLKITITSKIPQRHLIKLIKSVLTK